ncbi:hypothetical protein DQ04_02521050 [Trypanosoma grayi]|uniref:hypothetical protein n=1 Tax=Trypanosoma grayi TaxID=71804 RepID=UPI0004F45956|nr:hypothetical protein DQ04_02521050 [Trypanosoma grayi]KEG11539.1 hypothetical protein DQ04_02521050 [Trypanosoma grayi]
MPPPLVTHTREPSPATDPAPRLPLRQPGCLVEYERAKQQHDGGDADNRRRLTSSNAIEGCGQPLRRPGPLDKLSTYRRMRSLTHQSSGDDDVTSADHHVHSVNSDAALNKTGKAAEQPLLMTRLPKEMTKYIIDMEEQNRELRQEVIGLQEELQQQHIQLSAHQQLVDAIGGENRTNNQSVLSDSHIASGAFASPEEREHYMNDVLAQVDALVQAHRNQTEAEILKYKHEAETARLALSKLRETIALEGVDLSMLPAAMTTLTGRAPTADSSDSGGLVATATEDAITENNDDAAATGIATVMMEKCTPLVDAASDAVLHDLLRVEASDDVPAVVRQSVQRGIAALARHLASVVVEYVRHCTGEVRYLHEEREAIRRDLREEVRVSEHQRLRMAQRYETEIRALRDQLHTFHVAAATDGDALKSTIHTRALEECGALLVSSREEAAALRTQLEEERSDHAATCLRLKASLQRRNSDFEEAVVRRAEEIVRQRDARIAELGQQLDKIRRAEMQRTSGRTTKGVQTQAVKEIVLDEPHFMTNVLSLCSTRKEPVGLNQSFATPSFYAKHHPPATTTAAAAAATAAPSSTQLPMTPSGLGETEPTSFQHDGSFEEEVWAKTMELLRKYGALSRH